MPAGKQIVRLNLDETSVCVFQGGGAGNVFVNKRRAPVESVPAGKRRRCMTHVALVCDRADLQPLIPQFLIGNESTLLQKDLPALRALCPPNVRLIRQKSAWNNSKLCAKIIRELKKVLEPYMDVIQPVLVLDAARLHLAHALAACRATGVWPLIVPPKLTWLMQPLDTWGFSLYKHVMQMAYQRARASSADGDVSMHDFIKCVCEAVRVALQGRRWAYAFDADGFGYQQARLCERITHHLEVAAVADVPATRPSLEQLRLCFPRRTKTIPLKTLFGSVDALPAAAVVAVAGGRGRGVPAVIHGVPAAAAGGGAHAPLPCGGRGRGHVYGRTRSGALFKA